MIFIFHHFKGLRVNLNFACYFPTNISVEHNHARPRQIGSSAYPTGFGSFSEPFSIILFNDSEYKRKIFANEVEFNAKRFM